MKPIKIIQRSHDTGIEETKGYEGESIEDKIARITENNEPISDGAPMVYTKRSDGVRPEFNIRTDKWDIAQEKMGEVSSAKRKKIQESMTKGLEQKQEPEQEPQKMSENK